MRNGPEKIISVVVSKLKKNEKDKEPQINNVRMEKKYEDMFKTKLDSMTSCKVVKYRIITNPD